VAKAHAMQKSIVAALQIYKMPDIPGQIEKFGNELMETINNASLESGMEGK
jgi:hypothetical protein